MPLSNASRLADFGTGIGTAGAIIQVDNANQRLGVGTTAPTATLGVAGIVSATAFYGDGSNLDGVASAGLGTALSEVEFDPLTVIYQTSDTLSVGATITVDPPDATSKVAYTQYAEVKLEGDADLIVADGDDFIPDILGLSTEGFSFSNANGNGIFDTVYTDNIENAAGRGAPNFPLGITVSGISTLSGNVSIGGTLTYEDVTNVDSVGLITARSGIDITAGGLDVTSGLVSLGDNTNADSQLTITNSQGDCIRLRSKSDSNAFKYGIIKQEPYNNNSVGLQIIGGKSDSGYSEIAIGGGIDGGYAATQIDFYTGATTTTTTGTRRLRIGSAGQLGIGGANYGTSGQVLTSGGGSAAPQWADAGGGAWEVVSTTLLSGSVTYLDFNNWSNAYQRYQLVMNDLYYSNTLFKVYLRIYQDSTSGNTGTLKTASQYGYGSMDGQEAWGGMSSVPRQGTFSNYAKLAYNRDITVLDSAEYNFGMRTTTQSNSYPYWYGTMNRNANVHLADNGMYNTDKTEFMTGIRLYFFASDGTTAISPSQGRITLLRMKYS